MELDFTGKTAVVAGASSGIGAACARLLAGPARRPCSQGGTGIAWSVCSRRSRQQAGWRGLRSET